MESKLRKNLEDVLPPILYRNNPEFKRLVGLSPGTLKNLDSRGEGPAQRVKLGKVTGYPKSALIDFIGKKIKTYPEIEK